MTPIRNMTKYMLAGAMAMLLAACGSNQADKKASDAANTTGAPKVQVKVSKAVTRPVDQTAEFTGTINAFVRNNISSAGAVRIDKIYVEVGDKVSKGQLLVQMDQANYLQAKVQYENLVSEYKRIKELHEVGGVSAQQLDQLKTQMDVAKTAVDNLAENTKLLSPISGMVTARNFDAGDVSGNQPILTVQQVDPLKVLINVSEEYFAHVQKGQKVALALNVYPEKQFEGKVSLVYPTIDPMTRTFSVEITVQNPDLLIRPGMFARVNVNFGAVTRTLVPDVAVQKQNGTNERYLFVINNGVAERRVIELGRRLGDMYELVQGVKDGEQVAIAGISRLQDQAQVEVVQ